MNNDQSAGQSAAAPQADNWADSIKVEHSTPASDGSEPTAPQNPEPTPDPVDPPEGDQQPRKKPTGYLRKLGRAEAERDAAIRELEQLRQAQTQPAPQPQAPEAQEPVEPKVDDFNTYADYMAAVRKFDREVAKSEATKLVAETLAERDQAAKKEKETFAASQQVVKLAEDYTAQLEHYEQSNPGSKAKIQQAEEAGLFPDNLVLMTLQTENPTAVASYLAENIAELQALNQMPPQVARIALARIEGRLTAQRVDAAPVARQTQAAPPVRPAKPGSSGSTKSPHEMSLKELDQKWKPLN